MPSLSQRAYRAVYWFPLCVGVIRVLSDGDPACVCSLKFYLRALNKVLYKHVHPVSTHFIYLAESLLNQLVKNEKENSHLLVFLFHGLGLGWWANATGDNWIYRALEGFLSDRPTIGYLSSGSKVAASEEKNNVSIHTEKVQDVSHWYGLCSY